MYKYTNFYDGVGRIHPTIFNSVFSCAPANTLSNFY